MVLKPETQMTRKAKKEAEIRKRAEKARLKRTGRGRKPVSAKAKALADRRLKAGKYGSMDGDTTDKKSMTKKPTVPQAVKDRSKKEEIRKRAEKARLKRISKQNNSVKTKSSTKTSQEAKERSSVKIAKPKSKPVTVSKALADRRLKAGKYGSMDGDTSDPASMRKQPTIKPTATAKGGVSEGRTKGLQEKPKSKPVTVSKALANRRLKAGKYGSMDGDTYDPASMRKQLKSVSNSTTSTTKPSPVKSPTPKLGNVKVPSKPKEQAGDDYDRNNMTRRKEDTDDDYDSNSMKKRKPTKKKRDRLFGLDFLPKIDSKKGGDKVNLPFGLGSYTTLPQEEDYSKNKKGGRIKYKSGGKIRKAGCKRGMGKAMRGY